MTPEEIRSRVSEIRWHHSIDLGHGLVTPGQDNSARKLERLRLPDSFAGRTVLDVGAWDGFFSFDAARRGARRVLATDSYVWDGSHDWGSQRGFNLARQVLGSPVEDRQIDVLELSPERIGTFDVVLFLGILYHMKHPQLALERAASVTKEMLVLETVVDMLHCRRPAMALYVNDELGQDQTNWCGPNTAAVAGMLRIAGFKRIEIVSGLRSIWFRWARAAYYKLETWASILGAGPHGSNRHSRLEVTSLNDVRILTLFLKSKGHADDGGGTRRGATSSAAFSGATWDRDVREVSRLPSRPLGASSVAAARATATSQ